MNIPLHFKQMRYRTQQHKDNLLPQVMTTLKCMSYYYFKIHISTLRTSLIFPATALFLQNFYISDQN